MNAVLYALLPLVAASVYFFGWRALAVLGVVNAVGFLSEYIFARVYGKKVSMAVFVTNFLFALSLPPTIPLWIAGVGIAFGIVFGKMVFGGFSKNIFNPAISGRAFIYASFGYHLSSRFVQPAQGLLGGLGRWSPGLDSLTAATPLIQLKEGVDISFLELLLGNVSGSMGETSALLIIITGVWLMFRKTASHHIVLPGLAGFLVFQSLFWLTGIDGVPAPHYALVSGSVLFGMMYMATDPVTAAQTTNIGRWIYGAFIGILTSLIRTFSIWPEGITFAILTANMFAPLLNYIITEIKKSRRSRKGADA
ncbi:MAG: RnfABCDGE type electron transport complex subunit D [Spirochaetales bacterium]|nr:RnfABCDGE type electron transport complex subunit D [Spirochaetales bacterium]